MNKPQMPLCCLRSFAWDGIRTGFKLAKPGDTHTCEDCGRVYVMQGTWQLQDNVKSLDISEDDGAIH